MEAFPAGLLLCCRGPRMPLVGGTPRANHSRPPVTYAPLIGHWPAHLPRVSGGSTLHARAARLLFYSLYRRRSQK